MKKKLFKNSVCDFSGTCRQCDHFYLNCILDMPCAFTLNIYFHGFPVIFVLISASVNMNRDSNVKPSPEILLSIASYIFPPQFFYDKRLILCLHSATAETNCRTIRKSAC